MDTIRFKRVQELFQEAVDLPEADRDAFLEAACQGDGELLAEVRAMLEEDARGGSLLDMGLAHVAEEFFDQEGSSFDRLPVLGPYRLIRRIGEGGMGVVYLAERKDLGSEVAVKFLRDAWMSPARRERFAIEQRTLAHLNHPSIARIYDANSLDDGTPWFVMEYVEGLPITTYCARRQSSIAERLRLFRSVCEAVQYAHEHAIIHRDLKPSNILVQDGDGVKLLDFGIAKQLDAFDRPADQTRTELRLMTPSHAAPEQVRGGQVGVFTDVYALGVTLYELLTGRLPFDLSTMTPGTAEKVIVEKEPERPSQVGASTVKPPLSRSSWADLDVLCMTALHKDPQRRYRSVEALIRDIGRYLNNEPLEARPDSIRYRIGKFARRHRRAVAASALTFAVVAGLVTFFTVRLAVEHKRVQVAATKAQRVERFMVNLFEGGDKAAGPAEDLRVITMVDRGVQEAQALQQEPQVQAELYRTLGGIYEKLGKLDEADSLLTHALNQRRELFGGDNPEVAESLVALGLLRVDQAKMDEAERLIREGLEKTSRAQPRDNMAVARASTALGRVLEAKGAYDKAIPVLEQAVKLQSTAGAASPELAATLKELADTHFYLGHYDTCESLNRRTMEMHRQLFGEKHPTVADDLINLGAVQFERGNYKESERLYRQALEIQQAWYGRDHPETASTLSMLGRPLLLERRFDEATALMKEALRIRERVFGPSHPKVANILNELGSIALQQDRDKEAEEYYRRTAGIYKSAYGEGHYLYALSLSNLASVYLDEKEYAKAEPLFREAVARFSQALSPEHLNTGIAHIKLGRTLVKEKRYADAEEHSLAGYRILTKQTSPSVNWVVAARKDLVAIYGALNQPEKAAEFQK